MSAELQVLIVDDEPLARMRLASLVRECSEPLCVLAGEAGSAAQARAWLSENRCDVMLLDIHMPGDTGTLLAADLKTVPDAPAIVFVTAHAEHALEAFELDAVDYLTKPVRRERLHAALQRVFERRPSGGGSSRVLVVSDRGRMTRVPIDQVLYLKAELKYVTLRTAAHTHVLDESLTDLEQRLGENFIRVHRNALVAKQAVRALERRVLSGGDDGDEAAEGWAVRVAPTDEWLAVSRRQVAAVRDALEGGAV